MAYIKDKQDSVVLCETVFIHLLSIPSNDRSKASSKTIPPHSAIQSFLLQMRLPSPVLKVIQQFLTSSSSSSCHFHLSLYLSFDNLFQKFISISNVFTDITAVSTHSYIAFPPITNPYVSPNFLILTKFQSVQYTDYVRINAITALLTQPRGNTGC